MSENVIIRISNLKKKYRLGQIGTTTLSEAIENRINKLKNRSIVTEGKKDFWALNGISLDINKGDTVGIIGGNGAGKSTLLKILSGITAPTEGQIEYTGTISSMLEVGTGFNAEMTGRENIYLNGTILGMTRKEIDSKIDEIIEFSECEQFIDTPVKRYSSGMYVKLAFSVAAHLDSEILIMDEVLAVGDMNFQQKCLKKMRSLASEDGRTVLYVSHNMATIRQLCNKCIVLNRGRLEYYGDVDEAIKLYMDMGYSNSCRYKLSDEGRWIIPRIAKAIEFEFVDKEVSCYQSGEKMLFSLIWEALENVDEGCIRFDIKYITGEVVGVTQGDISCAKKGDVIKDIFCFDTDRFAPGRYMFTMSLRKKDIPIPLDAYDDLKTIFYFEIMPNDYNRGWNHSDFGNLFLEEIEHKDTIHIK
ncbi:ABC-type polysaccharide/polyol phosphate transport system, ATPase component [Pseudobutyrivibrio ruminis]|uniref:ABC-type polysaccharide/polyol phosphate transport system, ATPase component n=1 Tax=Pseudobutyrivibrio ruminis TaxID=46206 RepID=A0A1H7H6D2_9FIRM|nr:polysaccharide ABC transporter ATP-binding protein [Pseudobutyrivibrio ruminis]SEK45788.1 ABC-type polysaccharide/polyol phosphate transport system, ATPase component [Pseudobutyrivibrio ruminis]